MATQSMPRVSETAIVDVIDRIYAAASDFSLWPDALIGIADLLGAQDAGLGTAGPSSIPWLFAPRTDPHYLRRYPDYHEQDLAWHRIVARGVGASVTDSMVVDPIDLRRNPYHQEWSKPQGYHTKLGGLVLAEDDWRTVIVMPGKDQFDPEATRLFKMLSPHLKRAVQLNLRLARANAQDQLSTELIGKLPSSTLVVDANARVVLANDRAEEWFSRGLSIDSGALRASTSEATSRLRELICGCARTSLRGGGGGVEIGPRLRLDVLPLRCEMAGFGYDQPVAVLVESGGQSMPDRLAARFGLTAAEAAFAAEIVAGDGKRAAAARRNISYSTARTHLSRIFEKTGTHSQAELVRLILG